MSHNSTLIRTLPETIESEEALDDLLTRPRPILVEFIRSIRSPLLILGAGGKMGPTLAVLAKRAAREANHPLEVIAASRFSDERARTWMESKGVRTISCDLLNQIEVAKLPETENLLYLVGMKFGTTENASLTWVVNTLAPAHVAERFPHSRIVTLSTGNVYSFVPVQGGGAVESDPCTPLGEYPNAAIARERIFEHFSRMNRTPISFLRLNYAVELRYGVLVDIALKVQRGEPIDVTMGYLNCIWQGDANESIVRALADCSSPPTVFNLTGPQVWSVSDIAADFGRLLNSRVHFTGTESETALLSNPVRACERWGTPDTPIEAVIRWTANWIQNAGRLLHKPTHFEIRDGRY